MVIIFVAGGIFSAAAAFVIGRWLLSSHSKRAEAISLGALRDLLRIALPVRFAGLLQLGMEPLTRAALVRYTGLESVALYELAYRVVFQCRLAIVSGLQTLVPHLTRQGRFAGIEHRETVLGAAKLALTVAIPAFALAVVCVPALSIAVIGSSKPAIGVYAALLALAWLLNVASAPGYFANLAEGSVHRNWISMAVMCASNMLLAPIAGHAWGGIGVCAATAFAISAGSLATLASRTAESRQLIKRLSRSDYFSLLGGAAAALLVNVAWSRGLAGAPLFELVAAVAVIYLASVAPPIFRRLPPLLARGAP
jgi:O-antigen/teichoic acid export membrane protein